MSNTHNPELVEFQQFILDQIRTGEPPTSPEDCLSRYRAIYPSSEELAESVECIEQALTEKANGKGKSLKEFDADFRNRNSF